MKRFRRQGFTLVEVLIGVGILAVIGAVFLSVLRGSGKEMQYASEHFTAALLSQKVQEDCAQEVFLNPLGLETLGLEGDLVPTRITDGTSVFFSNIEDTKPPWGKIDKLSDGAIDFSMPTLYKQVSTYHLLVGGKRLSPLSSSNADKNLARLDLQFTWTTQTGKGEYGSQVIVAVPVTPKIAPHGIAYANAEIEKIGVLQLFDDPEGSFGAKVAGSGADYGTVFALARIQTGCEGFLYSLFFLQTQKSLRAWLDQARTINFNNPTPAHFQMAAQAASASYSMAREAYRFIRYLEPDTKALAGNLTPGKLGSYLLTNPENYKATLSEYVRLTRTFVWALNAAQYFHEILSLKSMSEFQDRKRQFYALLKLIDIYRLLLIVPGSSPVSPADYKRFWKHIETFSSGVNPALQRMAFQEIGLADNLPLMLQKFPGLADISRVLQEGQRFVAGLPPLPPEPPPFVLPPPDAE